jgi:hypothetical protein
MQHKTRPHSYAEADDRAQVRMAVAYLVGTRGGGLVIALALFVAMETGWLDRFQSALDRANLPSLPSLPDATVQDVFRGVADKVMNTQDSTSSLWQHGSAQVGRFQKGSHPGGADRRD